MISLIALIGTAQAIDLKWWGVGPNIASNLFPIEYPTSFPAGAKVGGLTGGDPLVDKVGFDLEVGGRGVLYPTSAGRLGARFQLGFGQNRFFRQEFTLEYDGTIVKQGSFQLLFGGGIGVGHERFNDDLGEDWLSVNYYPLRVQLAGLLRDNSRAYELGIFGTWHIAGAQKYYQNAADNNPTDGKGNASVAAGALYFGVGLDLTVYFGDFFTDKKKRTNKNGSNNNRKKKRH